MTQSNVESKQFDEFDAYNKFIAFILEYSGHDKVSKNKKTGNMYKEKQKGKKMKRNERKREEEKAICIKRATYK